MGKRSETGPGVPASRGSAFLGILGAFTGAVIGASFWALLIVTVPKDWRELAFLTGFLVGPMSCLGYRLFRGLRSMRFARNTVRICTVLSPLPGMLTAAAISLLVHNLPAARASEVLQRALAARLDREVLFALAIFSLFFLLSARLGYSFLLAYTDPVWYKDPRRLARVGDGGATFNMPLQWPLPPAADIPECFTVDKRLTVEGDTITVRERFKAPRSFSMKDVAGVVLGVSSGYNILYDKNNTMLAKFAWSRKNALLLGQYLLQQGVPFVDLNGDPIPTSVEEQTVPDRFTVREGKLYLILGCVSMALFGLLTVGGVLCGLFAEEPLFLAVPFLFLLPSGAWLLLSYRNRRLEVDGEQFAYTTAFGRTTRFRLDDIAVVAGGIEGKVKDREGKVLAWIDINMENADLLAVYLDRHMRGKEIN